MFTENKPDGMEKVSISLQIQCLQFGDGKSCFKMKRLTVFAFGTPGTWGLNLWLSHL